MFVHLRFNFNFYVSKIMHLKDRNLPRKPNNLVSEEPKQNYRVLRKFEDIAVLLATSEVLTIQSRYFTGFKNYSVCRYPQSNIFYSRTLP